MDQAIRMRGFVHLLFVFHNAAGHFMAIRSPNIKPKLDKRLVVDWIPIDIIIVILSNTNSGLL